MRLPSGLGAVVTGAGGGLGRELALALARRDARVVISDIDEAGAEETARLVRAAGGSAWVVPCDVASRDAVEALARRAEEAVGEVDVLCNNAGVAVSGPFEEVSLEDWRWIMDINLWGVVYGCQAFVPAMKRRRRGWVLNVASAAGLLCTPMMSPYNVTKAGVVALSESLHAELKSHGVTVSALCPTFFKTRIMEGGRGVPDAQREALVAKLMAKSKVQGSQVAERALEGLARDRLYIVPMSDGRTAWRLKRLAPQRFYSMLARGPGVLRRLGRRGPAPRPGAAEEKTAK